MLSVTHFTINCFCFRLPKVSLCCSISVISVCLIFFQDTLMLEWLRMQLVELTGWWFSKIPSFCLLTRMFLQTSDLFSLTTICPFYSWNSNLSMLNLRFQQWFSVSICYQQKKNKAHYSFFFYNIKPIKPLQKQLIILFGYDFLPEKKQLKGMNSTAVWGLSQNQNQL